MSTAPTTTTTTATTTTLPTTGSSTSGRWLKVGVSSTSTATATTNAGTTAITTSSTNDETSSSSNSNSAVNSVLDVNCAEESFVVASKSYTAKKKEKDGKDPEQVELGQPCLLYNTTSATNNNNINNNNNPIATTEMNTAMNTTTSTNNTTKEEEDPYENNTARVSLSLALPLTWNLTSPEHHAAVDSLLEEVSTTSTQLFQSTLKKAIKMLEEAPEPVDMNANTNNVTDATTTTLASTATTLRNGTGSGVEAAATTATAAAASTTSTFTATTTEDQSSQSSSPSNYSSSSDNPNALPLPPWPWQENSFTNNGTNNNNNMIGDPNLLFYPPNGSDDGDDIRANSSSIYNNSHINITTHGNNTYYSDVWLTDNTVEHDEDYNDDALQSQQQGQDELLWDWLDSTPLSKEELYHMVLEYLELDEPAATTNDTSALSSSSSSSSSSTSPSSSSPLLEDLKDEIRQAIWNMFFENGEQQQSNNDKGTMNQNSSGRDGIGNPTKENNNSTATTTTTIWENDMNSTHNNNDTSTSTTTTTTNENDNSNNGIQFVPSGLWEMFLANTTIELVSIQRARATRRITLPPDAAASYEYYAWWKVTMIYPVYVHVQEVIPPLQQPQEHEQDRMDDDDDDMHYTDDLENDDDVPQQQQQPIIIDPNNADNNNHSRNSNHNSTTATSSPESYMVPVQDQGTLDFIERLLQRVLEMAVLSGAFLSSLNDLASMNNYNDKGGGGDTVEDLVNHILGLAIPGSEYRVPLNDLMAHLDDESDAAGAANSTKERQDDGDDKPQWMRGTYTHGLLDYGDRSGDRNNGNDEYDYYDFYNYWHGQELMGLALLFVTCVGTTTMVLVAWLIRNDSDNSSTTTTTTMEQGLRLQTAETVPPDAWLLGTDHDVAEILRVGWRQYSIPANQGISLGPQQHKITRPKNQTGDDDDRDDAKGGGGGRCHEADMGNGKVVEIAEIIEVFDKSRAGYNDNDSMLHGSAMNQSFGCDESGPEIIQSCVDFKWGKRGNIFSSMKLNRAGDSNDNW